MTLAALVLAWEIRSQVACDGEPVPAWEIALRAPGNAPLGGGGLLGADGVVRCSPRCVTRLGWRLDLAEAYGAPLADVA